MRRDEVDAIMMLAGVTILGQNQIRNPYWPDHPDYDRMRERFPWWAVHVDGGTITIGWRKKVIAIDWSGTNRRGTITKDDVTKDDSLVHAWGFGKAVEYMRNWRALPVVDVTLPDIKTYVVEGKDKVLEMLEIMGGSGVENDLVISLVKEAKLGWTIAMSVTPLSDGGYSFNLRVGKLNIHHYPRG